MPFFANINENSTATFITNSPLRNTVRLLPKNKKLYAAQEHSFEAKGHFAPYIVSISLTKGTNPIQPALIFRQDLIENKQFKSLKQKEKENPNIKKLYGAMHAYTWGTGRTIETLNLLSSLGIKHMWIGYDVGEISKDKFQAEKNILKKQKLLAFSLVLMTLGQMYKIQKHQTLLYLSILMPGQMLLLCIKMAKNKVDLGIGVMKRALSILPFKNRKIKI